MSTEPAPQVWQCVDCGYVSSMRLLQCPECNQPECAHGVIGGECADPPCRECVAEDRGGEYVQWDREDRAGLVFDE